MPHEHISWMALPRTVHTMIDGGFIFLLTVHSVVEGRFNYVV
jgi:hypothetical protein